MTAIKMLKPNKAPGMGNFIKKKYKDVLTPHMRVFRDCLKMKKLPPSWTVAKMILINKPGKDPALLQSYSPDILIKLRL